MTKVPGKLKIYLAVLLCLSVIFVPAFSKINRAEAQIVSGSAAAGLTATELYFLLCATALFISAVCFQDKSFREAMDMAVDDFVENTQWAYDKAKKLIESAISSQPQVCPIENPIDIGLSFTTPYPYTKNFPPPYFPSSDIDTDRISQLARNVFSTPVMTAIGAVLTSFLADYGLHVNTTAPLDILEINLIEEQLSELMKNNLFKQELLAYMIALNTMLSSPLAGDSSTAISLLLERTGKCLNDPNFWKSLFAGAGTLNMYAVFILAGGLALDDPNMFKNTGITITNVGIFVGVSAIPFLMDFFHWKHKGMSPRFITGPAHLKQAYECLNSTGEMNIDVATARSIKQGLADLIVSLSGEGIVAWYKFSETAQQELRENQGK